MRVIRWTFKEQQKLSTYECRCKDQQEKIVYLFIREVHFFFTTPIQVSHTGNSAKCNEKAVSINRYRTSLKKYWMHAVGYWL